jgi:hypothetical protein
MSRAADANKRSQTPCEHETELAKVRAELEGKKSELEAVCLQLTDAEDGWAKSKAEAATAAGLVNTDVEQVTVCIGLSNTCELWKLKCHHCGGTRKA